MKKNISKSTYIHLSGSSKNRRIKARLIARNNSDKKVEKGYVQKVGAVNRFVNSNKSGKVLLVKIS